MKLLLLVPTFRKNYDEVLPSIWIRALQMIDVYKDEFGLDARVNNIFFLPDVVILYRNCGFMLRIILLVYRIFGAKIYWDTCVNYFEGGIDDRQRRNAQRMAEFVDGVICGTRSIEQSALNYANSTFIFEDPLPEENFVSKQGMPSWDSPVFVWCGASGKAHFLDAFHAQLNERLILVSDKAPQLSFHYTYINWKHATYSREIQRGDVAFLPRTIGKDDYYNKGHSSFKALIFAAVGMPIIANEIPSYRDMSLFYDGIVFLEDFADFESAVQSLKEKSFDVSALKERYSCSSQAARLIEYLVRCK